MILLELSFQSSHNHRMKNKNTLSPEAIIAIANRYEELTSDVYKALQELKGFMNKPEYKEAVEVVYTEDPTLEEAAVAVENACMNGEFSCFIQDLTEIVHLWEKE
jgi:septation ring formation regulator EzrA